MSRKRIVTGNNLGFLLLAGLGLMCLSAGCSRSEISGEPIQLEAPAIDYSDLPLSQHFMDLPSEDREKLLEDVEQSVTVGLPLGPRTPPRSRQDKNINGHMEFCVKSLEKAEKGSFEWREHLSTQIPEWKQYVYAYEYTEDQSRAEQAMLAILKAIQDNQMDIIQAAEALHALASSPIMTRRQAAVVLAWIQKEADRQSAGGASKLHGARLLYLSHLLPFLDSADSWHKQATQMLAGSALPVRVADDIQYACLLIKAIHIAGRSGISLDPKIMQEGRSAAYRLMMRLEPDGSPPQFEPFLKREGRRELLYSASKIYDADDLRFLAFGGIKNADIYPPSQLSVGFPRTGSYIMRSTWNIAWSITLDKGKGFQQWLGEDAAQLTVETKENVLSFYAYNKPQFLMIFPDNTLIADDWTMQVGITKPFGDIGFICDLVSSEQAGIQITFIRKASSWVLEAEKPISKLHIDFYRTDASSSVASNGVTQIRTAHPPWQMVHSGRGETRKHRGNVVAKTDGRADKVVRIEHPKRSGCHRAMEVKNLTWLTVSAAPYYFENDENRYYYGDKREKTLYSIERRAKLDYAVKVRFLGVPRVGSVKKPKAMK